MLQVHPARARRDVHGELRPVLQTRRVESRRAGAVEPELEVPRGGAVGDQGDRLHHGVRRVVQHLHVENGGEPTQALGADTERVDLVEELQAQLFGTVLRAPRPQRLDVHGRQQGLLRHHHRLFRRAPDTDPEDPRRAPVTTHGGDLLEVPGHEVVTGVQDGEAGLALGAATLGRDLDLQRVAGDQFHVHDRRGVVAGVRALAVRIGDHRGAQRIVRMGVGAAHALVDHLLDAGPGVPLHSHADLEEHDGDAGVLAHGAVPLGAHAGVDQDLGDRVLRGRRLLALVGLGQGPHEVDGVIVGNELKGIGDALNEVVLTNDGHGASRGTIGDFSVLPRPADPPIPV